MAARNRWVLVLSLVMLLAVGIITSGRLPTRAAAATSGTPPLASPTASPVASPTASPIASPTTAQPIVWVELGPNGVQIARAIATGACPTITIDGAVQPMTARAQPSAAFPVRVCQATIPAGAKAAAVAGRALHLLTGAPKRIAVIGDTGCRIKGSLIQDCNEPGQWSFTAIAREIAAWQPDLIIHVGDYHYRESACPAGDAGCAGSPTGDIWASWNADFFAPAAPLLTSAPWVFVRGNHEDCARAGAGWFLLLDPRPVPASGCEDYTDPYAIPVGSQTLVVMDTAVANDTTASNAQVAQFREQLQMVGQLAGDNGWLLTHRPIWGPVVPSGTTTLATGNVTLQAAADNSLPAGIKLLLDGHVHLAEVLGFEPSAGRPPVFIAGNSGTALDSPIKQPLEGVDIAGAKLAVARTYSEFGYLTLQASGTGWIGTEHTETGQVLTTCTVQGFAMTCTP